MTDFEDSYRLACIVLLSQSGQVLGQLAPCKLSTPWLQEVGELVAIAKQRSKLDITILRLLEVDDTELPEIVVTYLAELDQEQLEPAQVLPWAGQLDPHPLRLAYAQPGGPAQDIFWASDVLLQGGYGKVVERKQIRTWNLSSIWQLNTELDSFWLKSVPPFFAHEGPTLQLFADEQVPDVVAVDEHRMLLRHIPGADCYAASLEQMLLMIERLVDLQWRWQHRVEELLATGIPDAPAGLLVQQIPAIIAQHAHELDAQQQLVLSAFSDNLPERFSQLEACGIPQTLVHGDYHPGNWRGVGKDLTILDWGDCCVGHPLLDLPSLLERAGEHAAVLRLHWCKVWQSKLPAADVSKAIELVTPIASARMAVVYQHFLDNIEPSERIYHDADVLSCLNTTAIAISTT